MNKSILFGLGIFTILACSPEKEEATGPYFGNGFRNGWTDQNSTVIWTRLTLNPEMNYDGEPFLVPSDSLHRVLAASTDTTLIYGTQIPQGFNLDQMEGACPGTQGEVQLVYYPETDPAQKMETDWQQVDPQKNFTSQWKITGLAPDTRYLVTLYARGGSEQPVSDTMEGQFLTPPAPETIKPIDFCVVTCHDYIRKDDSLGHHIYPSMAAMNPDFYVHTGDIEYYDKPAPYALTEKLMYFQWDRYFALPYQRDFFSKTTTYFMKDDHDALSNDAYPGMTYGTVSFDRGLEIFDQEQFPTGEKPYKTVRWGKDLQIWIVEGRNYRSPNDAPDGPDKTIWGQVQKDWFFKTAKASDATFKVLISSTPVIGPDRENKHDNFSNSNFQYEGNQIREFINQFDNFYLCNGDRHWQYVSHWEGTNLWEFSVGAGADEHAEGWNQNDVRPEHRFLRVEGGFLRVQVDRENEVPVIRFQHCDVNGKVVHEEVFRREEQV